MTESVRAAQERTTGSDLARVFPGDSEMARRMRAFDWSQTPVGPVEGWPQTLRIALGICLSSRFPMHVWWGRSLTLFYNDAYISFLGRGKHPAVLGRSGREAWSEIWDVIGPMIDGVFRDGTASWSEDILMFFDRDLSHEEVYVTFSFSPVFGQDDRVEGMYCACTETTEKIVGNRRLDTLRKLGVQAAVAGSVAATCRSVSGVLDNNRADLPFSGIYLLDERTGVAHLAASTGLFIASTLPSTVSIGMSDHSSPWPLASALETKRAAIVDLDASGVRVQAAPWPEAVRRAIVLPIRYAAHESLAGLLVTGLSPRRLFDAAYRAFVDLLAGHIGAAIADARAYEEERRRVEALAALDRSKTDFFSNVSHEFRTPLTLLLGPLEEELRNNPGASERLSVAHRNALRLLKLVNTLLDFSRIEAGRIEASYEPIELGAFTTELASVFRSAVETAGLRLVIDCPSTAAPVYVDREMWEKIVLNLLSNAFKFTFDGAITVGVRQHARSLELTVSDTGVGIPASELPRVFERFHRIRVTRSRTHEGTGIGLALVQELVKLHSGEIVVQSEEGSGTTFTVSIPTGTAHLPKERIAAPRRLLATASGATAFVEESLRWISEPAARSVGPRTGARILLADDNADMRDYVRRILEHEYQVVAVSDGEAALAEAKRQLPDLVLADIMMPGLDGLGLLTRLRASEETRHIPIVLVSARAGDEARAEGLERGADDYLIKPFSASELLARVNTHVHLAHVRNDAAAAVRHSNLALEERTRELQVLLRRLVTAQEEERKRIARDVHDQFGQPMTALRLNLEALESTSGRELTRRIQRVQQLCEELDRSIDFLVWSLRPATLDHLGLSAALGELVRGWSDRFRVDAEYGTTGADLLRLAPEVETNVYRIAQESLHNVYKHARATHVSVSLEWRGDRAVLTIEDDGRGFDAEEMSNGDGLGLRSMRERAALIGGALDIESSGGRGTSVLLRFPVEQHVEDSNPVG